MVALLAGLAMSLPAHSVSAADDGPLSTVKALLDQAKDHGAKGQLPAAWWDLDRRYDAARKGDPAPETVAGLESDARLLLNKALFIERMRKQKSGLEALLGRYDQALDEIAALTGVPLPAEVTGDDRSDALQQGLQAAWTQLRVRADSLAVASRYLQETLGQQVAAQDSVITALRVANSALRQKVWETELRAGVAEADRSAAESVLSRKQEFEDSVARLRDSFTSEDGEILLTGEGAVLIRLHGIAFGVGSAELAPGQDDLVSRLKKALLAFPGAKVTISGHTDDTGTRQANLRLSRRRAETVARLLEGDLAWPEGTIGTEGYGPDRPVALNDSPEGRALNRRIDVLIVPGQ